MKYNTFFFFFLPDLHIVPGLPLAFLQPYHIPVSSLLAFFFFFKITSLYSLVAQLVKNLPAMRETWIQSLGWEASPEKGTATHSCILAWRIPWTV